MASFDAFRNWVIIIPSCSPVAERAAKDLSRCIGLLRGPGGQAPELVEASGPPPAATVPVIVLNNGDGGPERNGFSWRTGYTRIEIYGESERGLRNGIYDFLSALDINWPRPDFTESNETLPPLQATRIYPLKSASIHEPGSVPDEDNALSSLKRFVIPKKSPISGSQKKQEALAAWAARYKFSAVVFPFNGLNLNHKPAAKKNNVEELFASYGLSLEAGGWALSLLVPRKLFLFHRELFRMEGGKRRRRINFCPTNPQTIETIKAEGKKLFLKFPGIRVFNLWPDRENEKTWCSCPGCRAFSPAEQNRIAVNAAADALMEINKEAFISLYETGNEGNNIPLRPNVFRVETRLVHNGSLSY